MNFNTNMNWNNVLLVFRETDKEFDEKKLTKNKSKHKTKAKLKIKILFKREIKEKYISLNSI